MIFIGRHQFEESVIENLIADAKKSVWKFHIAVIKQVHEMTGLNNTEENELIAYVLSEAGHRGGNRRTKKRVVAKATATIPVVQDMDCEWFKHGQCKCVPNDGCVFGKF